MGWPICLAQRAVGSTLDRVVFAYRCNLGPPDGSADHDRTPGMEEYIEASSFLHYLDHGSLITLEEVQRNLSDKETGEPVSTSHPGSLFALQLHLVMLGTDDALQLVVVTPEDYILGMSDLTGELMRYATNGQWSIALFSSTSYTYRGMLTGDTALSTGDHESPLSVCDFVRTVKSCQSNRARTVLHTPHPGLTFRHLPS